MLARTAHTTRRLLPAAIAALQLSAAAAALAQGTPFVAVLTDGQQWRVENPFNEPPSLMFSFGQPGAVPIAGDWNNDNTDTIGIYMPATGTFFLRNSNSSGPADVVFNFGPANLVPIKGDWDGDGDDTVGLYSP